MHTHWFDKILKFSYTDAEVVILFKSRRCLKYFITMKLKKLKIDKTGTTVYRNL